MKKVTMKDIAKRANVSVATVSYVLNNVPNQTIPKETRELILNIAEELRYVLNLTARSLVKRRSGLIGIIVPKVLKGAYWSHYRYSAFIREMEEHCAKHGYHVMLYSIDPVEPRLDIIAERELDGVFIVDVNQEVFYTISRQFPMGVPIVLFDSELDDQLFHKVLPDFEAAMKRALLLLGEKPSFLIMDRYNNRSLAQRIRSAAGLAEQQVFVVEDETELNQVLHLCQARHGFIVNEMLALLAAKQTEPERLTVICTCHSSSLLPVGMRAVEFTANGANAAWQIMSGHLTDQPIEGDKYIKIGVQEHTR